MHVTVNIASQPHRLPTLRRVVKLLQANTRPPDAIRIYWNGANPPKIKNASVTTGKDLTDNGKFYFFQPDSGIYFTCDDDIAYPSDYIERTISKLANYPECILSYHGRRLINREQRYYARATPYRFSNPLQSDALLDVPGTGVMAFDTRHFDASIIAHDPRRRMTDVLVGLEASKQGVQIICPSRANQWLKDIGTDMGIYGDERLNDHVQTEICKEIYDNKLTF